jgi:hypothetical protein
LQVPLLSRKVTVEGGITPSRREWRLTHDPAPSAARSASPPILLSHSSLVRPSRDRQ